MAVKKTLVGTKRIIQDPKIMGGKPVVKGTRILVEQVLAQLAKEPDTKELFAAYPELTLEDVKACLAYAHHVVSANKKKSVRRQVKPVTEDDPLFRMIGSGHSGKGDISANKHQYLLEAYKSKHS